MSTYSRRSAASLILALTMLPFGFAPSQRAVAQSWEERFQVGRQQQPFLTQYVNDHPPEQPLTPSRIDAYLQTLEQAWKREIDASASTAAWKREVSPDLYYYLLQNQITDESLSEEVRCHLFTQHMAPAFLESVARYKDAPTTGNLYPVTSSVSVGFPTLALECEITSAQWSALQGRMERLPNLLETHLNRDSNDLDDGVRSFLQRMHKRFEQLQPVLAIRGALYQSNLDVAFAELAAISTKGELAPYVRVLGKQLWRRYERRGKTDQALATLDLLARSLTAGDLPRDSLRNWYSAVDPEHGSERFQRITGASSPRSLVPAEESAKLQGTYRNLTTGEPFDLSELEGKTVLFDFWATWCAPCIEEIPELKRFASEYSDDLILVSVSGDPITGGEDQDGVRDFIEKHDITYTALYDDSDDPLTERFEVTSWPSKFLVNEDGRILKHPTDETRLTVTLEEVKAYLRSQN